MTSGPGSALIPAISAARSPRASRVTGQEHSRGHQRAPACQWPDGRLNWAPAAEPDPGQRRLLQRFIAAHEQADPEALIAMLRDDIRLAISPQVGEWNGDGRRATRSAMT